jgi:small subunit ribosomal protein S17
MDQDKMEQVVSKRMITGVVVSDKMDKTKVIVVQRQMKDRAYHKGIKRQSRFFIHDETNSAKTGDKVVAVETRPISRHKNFKLIKVLEKRVVEE